MFCRKCGKSIPDDSAFCPYCGQTVKSDEPEEKGHGYCSNCGAPLPAGKITGLCDSCMNEADTKAAEYPPYQEVTSTKKSHKGAIAGGIIVSVFAIIVLAAIGNSSAGATQAAAQNSESESASSAPLSVRQQKIQTAFDDTIAGDVEGTVKKCLKKPNTAIFSHDTTKLSVNNAIFTDTGTVSYTNAAGKSTKDNFTVSIIATDKVYYPLYVKVGNTVSEDSRKGTNSLGIATGSGDIFDKTEGESIFGKSDGNIIFISDPVHEDMSLDEYSRIKTNMSYADVSEIVGSYGNEEAHSDVEGYTGDVYSWVGNGSAGSNANVTFQNGRVIAKAQVGLQ